MQSNTNKGYLQLERMKKDLSDGECYIFANSKQEYEAFINWLCGNGAEFSYHFESGEGYWFKGVIVEVYGL